jgi:hypothetical protein
MIFNCATKSDVFKFLERNNATFDIVLLIHYGLDQAKHSKNSFTYFSKRTLSQEGMMIIEHSKYTKLNHMPHFLFKSYGGSILLFEFESDADSLVSRVIMSEER